jgi:hypothetical protein
MKPSCLPRQLPSSSHDIPHVIFGAWGTDRTKPSNHMFRDFTDVPTHVRDYQLDLNHTSAQPPRSEMSVQPEWSLPVWEKVDEKGIAGGLAIGLEPQNPVFQYLQTSLGCCTAQRFIQQEFRRFLTGSRRRSVRALSHLIESLSMRAWRSSLAEPASHLYLHSGVIGITLSFDAASRILDYICYSKMSLRYGVGYGCKDVLAREIPKRSSQRGLEEMSSETGATKTGASREVRWLKWQFHYRITECQTITTKYAKIAASCARGLSAYEATVHQRVGRCAWLHVF